MGRGPAGTGVEWARWMWAHLLQGLVPEDGPAASVLTGGRGAEGGVRFGEAVLFWGLRPLRNANRAEDLT